MEAADACENPGLEGRETWGTQLGNNGLGHASCYNFTVAGIRFRGNPEGNSVISSTGASFTVRVSEIKISSIQVY